MNATIGLILIGLGNSKLKVGNVTIKVKSSFNYSMHIDLKNQIFVSLKIMLLVFASANF